MRGNYERGRDEEKGEGKIGKEDWERGKRRKIEKEIDWEEGNRRIDQNNINKEMEDPTRIL